MTGTILRKPSATSARYWTELKDLSDNVKLELITLLSSSMTRTDVDVKKEARDRFEAALAKFSGDFGGNKDASEVARELRQGAEMVRDVDTW